MTHLPCVPYTHLIHRVDKYSCADMHLRFITELNEISGCGVSQLGSLTTVSTKYKRIFARLRKREESRS